MVEAAAGPGGVLGECWRNCWVSGGVGVGEGRGAQAEETSGGRE